MYAFQARNGTELSINPGEMLLVAQNSDGSWPTAEKWMNGLNETTNERGEFPAGAYVMFIEEIGEENNEPEPPPPEIERRYPVHLPQQRSPRHTSSCPPGIRLPGLAKPLTRGTENMGTEVSEEEDPPPPPPRRPGRGIDNHVSPRENPPQAPPRPFPRKKSSSVNSPGHDRDRHRWIQVMFHIPVPCTACKWFIFI